MTKREEIREGIVQGVNLILLHSLIKPKDSSWYFSPSNTDKYREWLENEVDNEIIKPMGSQGVVIKVERELPECNNCPVSVVCGYTAVVPIK